MNEDMYMKITAKTEPIKGMKLVKAWGKWFLVDADVVFMTAENPGNSSEGFLIVGWTAKPVFTTSGINKEEMAWYSAPNNLPLASTLTKPINRLSIAMPPRYIHATLKAEYSLRVVQADGSVKRLKE